MLWARETWSIHIPERILEADRALVRQRFRLAKDLTRTKLRVISLLFQFDIKIPDRFTVAQTRSWPKNYTNRLRGLPIAEQGLKQTLDNYLKVGESQRKHLLRVVKQIRELSQQERYKKNYELLLTIPGVGPKTAMSFLTQIGDIKRFKQLYHLGSYVGLVPNMHSSGEKTRTGKLTGRGRKEFKIMLIEVAWVAVRKDPALLAKFTKLSKRMHKNKAIIRIARKVLARIRYVLINQQEYVPGVVS